MAANKAVNGYIATSKRCHLVGLPIKTEICLQPFKSVYFLLWEAAESLRE